MRGYGISILLPFAFSGCAPGDEVSAMALSVGEKGEAEISFNKRDEIHFWEDFSHFSESGSGWTSNRLGCYQWNIAIREVGEKKQKLACPSLVGSRCDRKYNNTKGINCKVPDCIATVKKGGTVKIEAVLEKKQADCGVGVRDMALRIRRVKP